MSWRNGIIIVLVGLGWFLTPSSVATAQERVALIIGNGAYQHVPALPNPVNDANDLAASFERLGFTIYRVNDGTYEQMRLSLVRLAEHVAHAEMIVVFFAGHGMEINGENWLIPVDAEVKSDLAIEHESISLQSILPLVSSASRLGLVILDACRNNPFSA